MRHFLKIIHKFSLLANYNQIDKIGFFFKLLLFLPIRKLAIKRDSSAISSTKYKIRKFLFNHHRSISSFVHQTSQKILKSQCLKIKVPRISCYYYSKRSVIRDFLVVNHNIAF